MLFLDPSHYLNLNLYFYIEKLPKNLPLLHFIWMTSLELLKPIKKSLFLYIINFFYAWFGFD